MSYQSPTIYRAASKGKAFTRTEKINLILRKREIEENRANLKAINEAEKKRVREEKEARQFFSRRLRAMIENPDQKIKTNKKGEIYFQPRGQKGKLLPKVVI